VIVVDFPDIDEKSATILAGARRCHENVARAGKLRGTRGSPVLTGLRGRLESRRPQEPDPGHAGEGSGTMDTPADSAAGGTAGSTGASGTRTGNSGPASTGPASTDVLIIGAGIIGLSIAWRAAQRGMHVLVADPAPGSGATQAAAGMLTPVAEAAYAEKELFRLGRQSLLRYPAFAAELTDLTGKPTGFRQDGTLQVAYDQSDLAVLDEHYLLQESLGGPARRLTARECRAAEPLLDPAVRGGLLAPNDGSVDPRLLSSALLAAVDAAGGVLARQRAAELKITGGRAIGALLADGTQVLARWVVLAAGWESGAITGLPADIAPPVRPVKGQILRLRPTPATLAAGLPPGLLARTVRGIVRGSSVYLVPRQSGELVIGATQEELGADTRVTAGGVWELLRDARTLVPGITELELVEAAAGLRPGTPDNAPVLGPSELPGLVLATGHFRSGVLLAPVTADIIVAWLATERLPDAALPFLPQRFLRPDQSGRTWK
jgi:glycine oxidase